MEPKVSRRDSIAYLRGVTLLLAAFISSSSAQEKLPEYGDITDIKGMSKVYVSAPSTGQRKMILGELKKAPTLTVVKSPDEAEFFLDYRIVEESHPFGLNFVTAELAAYTIKDGRRRIAWSETKHLTSPSQLPRAFIKALKKTTDEKK